MSIHISSLVWKAEMAPTKKLVLLKLADNANDDGVGWPSIARIVRETCLSRSTVCEHLKAMEEEGIISRSHTENPQDSTRYLLHIQKISSLLNASAATGPVRPPDIGSPAIGLGESGHRSEVVRPPDPNHNRTVSEPSMNLQRNFFDDELASSPPKKKVTTKTPLMIRIGKIMGRMETTQWQANEVKAFREIQFEEESILMVETFYKATERQGEMLARRTGLLSLLNHWQGEVDKARAYAKKYGIRSFTEDTPRPKGVIR